MRLDDAIDRESERPDLGQVAAVDHRLKNVKPRGLGLKKLSLSFAIGRGVHCGSFVVGTLERGCKDLGNNGDVSTSWQTTKTCETSGCRTRSGKLWPMLQRPWASAGRLLSARPHWPQRAFQHYSREIARIMLPPDPLPPCYIGGLRGSRRLREAARTGNQNRRHRGPAQLGPKMAASLVEERAFDFDDARKARKDEQRTSPGLVR